MSYQSLYRKWRPQAFGDGFVGQEHVVRTLRNALLQHRVGHAYLFAGPRGTGKTTSAKVFSKAINCQNPRPNADPCNECESCQRINAGISMDVLEIDGASTRGIDEIRDLREKVKFAPAEGKYKIYIIDEVHMLTTEAFNALLKTLEEPPAHVIFIFATTEVQKVPATILSRCQRFDFKRLSVPEIVERLQSILQEEGRDAEPEALRMIALRADGGMRDAIGLLEQTLAHAEARIAAKDVRAVLGLVEEEQIFALVQAILRRDVASALRSIETLRTEGKDLYLMARESAYFLRDLLLLALPDEAGSLVHMEGEFREKSRQLAKSVSLVRLRRAAEIMFDTAQVVRRGAEWALPLEVAIVRLITEDEMDPYDKIALLEERLNRLEKNGVPVPVDRSKETVTPANVQAPEVKTPPTPAKQQQETTPSEKEKGQVKTEKTVETTDAGTDGTSFADRWEELLKALKEKKRTVEALLREGQPGPCQNGRWSIYFAPHLRFHIDNLNQPATKNLINQTAAQVFGAPIVVECRSADEKRVEEEHSVPTEPQTSGEPDDFLEKSLAIFGGEAVQIKEEKIE
jgi:DNA polymerase-3 subunit gamma/tau